MINTFLLYSTLHTGLYGRVVINSMREQTNGAIGSRVALERACDCADQIFTFRCKAGESSRESAYFWRPGVGEKNHLNFRLLKNNIFI